MEKIYARIDDEMALKLKIAAARRRMNQPAAIADAIEQWLATCDENGNPLMSGETPSTSTRKIALTSVHDGGVLYGSPGNSELLSTITPQEIPLVEQFICLVRSTIPGLSMAITSNVQTFTAYRELHERGAGNPHQSTAPGDTQAGVGGTGDALRSLERRAADADRTASQSARADEAIAAELADIARDGRDKRPEEAGDTARTRKRRGA